MLYKKMIQTELLVCNEYDCTLFLIQVLKEGIIYMILFFNTETFFKPFNMSKSIYTSQIFMIYLKLGDTNDIA